MLNCQTSWMRVVIIHHKQCGSYHTHVLYEPRGNMAKVMGCVYGKMVQITHFCAQNVTVRK